MKEIIDAFLSEDPIASDKAKSELAGMGESCLDEVASRFGSFVWRRHIENGLGELFSKFPKKAIPLLISILEEGIWSRMTDATFCFAGLPENPTAEKLYPMLSSASMDKRRCVIQAYGYLGAYGSEIHRSVDPKDEYEWGKLSFNIIVALFRMVGKEGNSGELYRKLNAIESFSQKIGIEKFIHLYQESYHALDPLIRNFTSATADGLVSRWLVHEHHIFRKIAAKALGIMKLERAIPTIKKQIIFSRDPKIKEDFFLSLISMQTRKAWNALKELYVEAGAGDNMYKAYLLPCLYYEKDKNFVRRIASPYESFYAYYAMGVCGLKPSFWEDAMLSNDFEARASVAPVFSRLGNTQKLVEMERNASHELEFAIIIASLINAGATDRVGELQKYLVRVSTEMSLWRLDPIWRREIIFALKILPSGERQVWESLLKINLPVAAEEMSEMNLTFKKLEKKASAQPVRSNKIEIFFSYAWGEKREDIVDALYTSLRREKGFKLVRDKVDLGYKGLISNFMSKIGQGHYVIVALSDKYIKSEYCMYELCELYMKAGLDTKELLKRIFPLMAGTVSLSKASGRNAYKQYWNKQLKQIETEIRKSPRTVLSERYKRVKRISHELPALLEFLADVNMLTMKHLKREDFSVIKKAIRERVRENQG